MNTPTPTETVSPSPSASEERLAQLTGFDPSSTQSVHSSPLSSASHPRSPLLSDEDLEEQITRHSFASSPLSKLVSVAGWLSTIFCLASVFPGDWGVNRGGGLEAIASATPPRKEPT